MKTSVIEKMQTLNDFRSIDKIEEIKFQHNKDFRTFYFKLNREERSFFKTKVIAKCLIVDAVFRNWLTSRTRIPELAKPIIEGIADAPVFSTLSIKVPQSEVQNQ